VSNRQSVLDFTSLATAANLLGALPARAASIVALLCHSTLGAEDALGQTAVNIAVVYAIACLCLSPILPDDKFQGGPNVIDGASLSPVAVALANTCIMPTATRRRARRRPVPVTRRRCPSQAAGAPVVKMRKPGLMPSFCTTGLPEVPGMDRSGFLRLRLRLEPRIGAWARLAGRRHRGGARRGGLQHRLAVRLLAVEQILDLLAAQGFVFQ
jgi:hypothetical protein